MLTSPGPWRQDGEKVIDADGRPVALSPEPKTLKGKGNLYLLAEAFEMRDILIRFWKEHGEQLAEANPGLCQRLLHSIQRGKGQR